MKADVRALQAELAALTKTTRQELRRLRNASRRLQGEKDALRVLLIAKAVATEEEVEKEEEEQERPRKEASALTQPR